MDNPLLMWAIICLVLALALFVLELFIPSGGVLGIVSGLALLTGLGLLFAVDTTWGLIASIVCLGLIPLAVWGAMALWPHTPIGRLLTLSHQQTPLNPGAQQTTPAQASAGQSTPAPPLVGAQGRALTDLRPVGIVQFEDQRLDCLSQAGLIRSGSTVEVAAVDGMHIKVRPIL